MSKKIVRDVEMTIDGVDLSSFVRTIDFDVAHSAHITMCTEKFDPTDWFDEEILVSIPSARELIAEAGLDVGTRFDLVIEGRPFPMIVTHVDEDDLIYTCESQEAA